MADTAVAAESTPVTIKRLRVETGFAWVVVRSVLVEAGIPIVFDSSGRRRPSHIPAEWVESARTVLRLHRHKLDNIHG